MDWEEKVASALSAAAGVAGSILTPLYGQKLAGAVEAILQALSGLLILLPVGLTAKVAIEKTKANLALHHDLEMNQVQRTAV